MEYIMSVLVNSDHSPDETVSEEYVKNFTSLATRKFFVKNLEGRESMRTLRGGVIHCVSINPDKTITKVTVFTPKRSI